MRVTTSDRNAAAAGVVSQPLATPRPPTLRASEIGSLVVAFLAALVFVWARHGGVTALGRNWFDAWSSITRLSGLLASGAGLLGLVLIARPRNLERHIGLDRMFVWHRYLGESMAILLGIHILAGLLAASANGGTIWSALREYSGREPYMALATVGSVLIFIVTLSSLRSIRRQMSFETWYFVHLLAYAGFAISFSHEIVLGRDFSDSPVDRWIWVVVHLGVLVAILSGRWGRTIRSMMRPMKVHSVKRLGKNVAAVTLTSPLLGNVEAHAGQFCMLRPLRAGLWWQSHPFSLSAAPTSRGLRFTIKDRGDASSAIGRLPVGTRVAVEGPYGVATPDLAAGRKVLCIVGGVGVAPARAMLELLSPEQQPIVMYRARSRADLVHLDEMQELARHVRGEVLTLVGPSLSLAGKDPFGAKALRSAVPDLLNRAVFVCGPDSLVHAARHGLKAAGVPAASVHFEMVWW